jgi:hypothetical protein
MKTFITNYPYAYDRYWTKKGGTIRTSWGEIVAKEFSFEFRIENIGVIEVFGWLTAEKKRNKIFVEGTTYDEEENVIKAVLEA